jgi:hypothetical protein
MIDYLITSIHWDALASTHTSLYDDTGLMCISDKRATGRLGVIIMSSMGYRGTRALLLHKV